MNKLVSKQLSGINSQLTGVNTPLSDERWQLLNDIAAAPYEQNENFYYIYRSVFAKAAKLGCEMVRRKPFEQENDLTAVVSTLTMLEVNGVGIKDYKQNIGELYDLFAANDVSGAEKWLEQHR